MQKIYLFLSMDGILQLVHELLFYFLVAIRSRDYPFTRTYCIFWHVISPNQVMVVRPDFKLGEGYALFSTVGFIHISDLSSFLCSACVDLLVLVCAFSAVVQVLGNNFYHLCMHDEIFMSHLKHAGCKRSWQQPDFPCVGSNMVTWSRSSLPSPLSLAIWM